MRRIARCRCRQEPLLDLYSSGVGGKRRRRGYWLSRDLFTVFIRKSGGGTLVGGLDLGGWNSKGPWIRHPRLRFSRGRSVSGPRYPLAQLLVSIPPLQAVGCVHFSDIVTTFFPHLVSRQRFSWLGKPFGDVCPRASHGLYIPGKCQTHKGGPGDFAHCVWGSAARRAGYYGRRSHARQVNQYRDTKLLQQTPLADSYKRVTSANQAG